jgi:TRAP-type transport system periplasmic protein
MNRVRFRRSLMIALSLSILAAYASVAPWPSDAAPKTITLRAVCFLPAQTVVVRFLPIYADKVNKKSKGELNIQFLGGPEVIPTAALSEAVIKGRVDIALNAANLFIDKVPEVYGLALSRHTAMEERKNGDYEWVNQYFNKMNLEYLGRAKTDLPMILASNFPVTTPKDFAGHQFGALDFTIGFTKALGATPVNVPKPDWFISVQRGVVDGYCLPVGNIVSYKLHEITKFLIDHDLKFDHEIIVMNRDKWKSLPPHLQKLMTEVAAEMEPEVRAFYTEDTQRSRKAMQDAGMKFVKFSPADAKSYMDTFKKAIMDDFKKAVNPESYNRTVERFSK